MLRDINLNEISDGRRYTANDLVKAGCNDCKGCSSCCRGMGESLLLDPMDIYHLTTGTGKTFQELLADSVELHIVDGVILPNMKMTGKGEACFYLNENGRCTIHSFRPGICRLFPLGRIYEDGGFSYFLQTGECPMEPKTKVKIKKWLDAGPIGAYENFICRWHYFLKDAAHVADGCGEALQKKIMMLILEIFFNRPYAANDFYGQFEERMKEARQSLGLAGEA